MAIIVGVVLLLTVFYYWLSGHWFARILMLPICALAAGLLFWLVMCSRMTQPDQLGGNAVAIVFGVAVAWWISGIPVRYWRRRMPPLQLGLGSRG